MQQLPILTVPISIHDASVDAEIQKLEVATFPLSEERGVESNSSSEKAMNGSWKKQDMVAQLEERIVQTTQALELL
jgi:hypothetical protein